MSASLRRLAVVLVVIVGSVSAFATPAGAITSTSSTPAPGASVQPPATVTIVYDATLDTVNSDPSLCSASSTDSCIALFKNGNPLAGAQSFMQTTLPNDTIVFTPSSTLSDGTYSVVAHAEDLLSAEEVDTTFPFSVDTVDPAAPTITGKTNPVNAANQTAVTISGAAEQGAVVTVFIDDNTNDVSTSVGPLPGTTYTATLDVTTLVNGTLDVTTSATDAAGNVSANTFTQIVKDSAIPERPGMTIVDDPITEANQTLVDITGTSAEAGLAIAVSVDDDANAGTAPIAKSTTTAVDGTWAVQANLSTLAQGLITATATATDAAGNTSATRTDTATKELGPPKLVSISPEDGSTGSSPGAITAIYDEALDVADSTITVKDNTLVSIAGATTFGAGNTSITFTPSAELTQSGSPYTVTLAVQDVANQPESPATEITFAVIDVDFVSIPQNVSGTYIPLRGDYDDDGTSDIFWYRPGNASDGLWLSDGDGTFTSAPQNVSGTYTPIVGDFGGNFATDIFWYRPGNASDGLWLSDGDGTFTSTPQNVSGTYTPITGDYDGDTFDDIFWYRPGTASDGLWLALGDGTFTSVPQTVNGTHTAITGDFNGDTFDDIFWYTPGDAADFLWLSNGDGTFTSIAKNVSGTYTPIASDHDGDGATDIFWYRPGTASDALWISNGDGSFTSVAQTVNGTHTPILGDFNGDTHDDIFWYSPGNAADPLWLSEGDGNFTAIARNVSGTYTPIAGDHDADGATDIFWYRPGTASDALWLADVT